MIKRYRINPDDTEMYRISVVDAPAIESNFVQLAEQKKKLYFQEDEKKEKYMFYGAVLIPDFDIYRNDSYGEYYISFSAECIEKMEQEYIGAGWNNRAWDEQHDGAWLEGMTIVESWIKAGESDKSAELGIDVPVGTWLIGVKCNNIDIWNKAKAGELNGFSIEAFCSLEEIESKLKKQEKNDTKMENNNKLSEIFSKIKELILGAEEPVKEEEQVDVQDVNLEEEKPAEEPKEEQQPEAAIEPEAEEEPKAEEETPAPAEEPKEEVNLSSQVEELRKEIESLKAENVALKAENEKLSKQPSVKLEEVKPDRVTYADIWEYRNR